jgi:hypothetical protein
MISHNYFMGNRPAIFFKNKELENSIVLALMLSSIWCIGEQAPLCITQGMLLTLTLAAVLHVMYKLVLSKKYFEKHQHQEAKFVGNITRLLPLLYKTGLVLKTKIGDYYVFSTDYTFLPNSRFIVLNNNESCILQAKNIDRLLKRTHQVRGVKQRKHDK